MRRHLAAAVATATAFALLLSARPVDAQTPHAHDPSHAEAPKAGIDSAGGDTAFAAVQARGRIAMGVDQYSSRHRFEALPDGGRIELQRDPADTAGVRTIREHLQAIARAFAAGNFETPGFVHDREVPGVRVMAARRDRIRYEFRPLPGGGEVRITARDADAITAVREFLAFQRMDHHVEVQE
ncbi:MAG TPA: hypothetical protein VFT04_14925 [Gemmatimonadales bacterium]|nr:hypothetical protein [Gemmatimonadales bacterium]